MRTTLGDVLRFAYHLWKARRARKHMRIGQILAAAAWHPNLFYTENDRLCRQIDRYEERFRVLAADSFPARKDG